MTRLRLDAIIALLVIGGALSAIGLSGRQARTAKAKALLA